MWNLSKEKTKEKYIAVGDCPNKECGLKDTPFSGRVEHFTHKDTKNKLTVTFISCPKCDTMINFDGETLKAIKGYISVKDMLDAGYKETKGINDIS